MKLTKSIIRTAPNKVLNLISSATLVLRFNATLPQNKSVRFGKLARRYRPDS